MKILSIKQPWAWLIVHGYKDIENREWPTNVRGQILIHAGKKFDTEGYDWLEINMPEIWAKMPHSYYAYGSGGIVGTAELVDCVEQSDSKWFVGKFGFVLKNAKPLPLFICKGRLGFFEAEYTNGR